MQVLGKYDSHDIEDRCYQIDGLTSKMRSFAKSTESRYVDRMILRPRPPFSRYEQTIHERSNFSVKVLENFNDKLEDSKCNALVKKGDLWNEQ